MIKNLILGMMLFSSLMPSLVSAREKLSINLGWKYHSGDIANAAAPTFDDASWQSLDLPHDASVYGPFLKEGNGASSRNGYRPLGKGWYRKAIDFNPQWQGKHIVLEFEGVYRKAQVYVNGTLCEGTHANGYIDFELDITSLLRPGRNIIAVFYDNTYTKSSRWYNGEGINRDVWLHILDDVHVARYGTYITTPKITPAYANVNISTSIKNERRDSVACRLVTSIVDPNGNTVATAEAVAPFAAGETYDFSQTVKVNSPQLWNVGDGKLYTAITHVYADTKPYNGNVRTAFDWTATPTDTYQTTFGIREIELTPIADSSSMASASTSMAYACIPTSDLLAQPRLPKPGVSASLLSPPSLAAMVCAFPTMPTPNMYSIGLTATASS